MCNSSIKSVPSHLYRSTLAEFNVACGIMSPIIADNIINDPFLVKRGDFINGVIDNVINIMENTSRRRNTVVGYFAAKKNDDTTSDMKYITTMSFCVPEDYGKFNNQFAKYLAMRKCLANSCMMAHVTKPQQVITNGSWPIYYFDIDNTIDIQYMEFETRCINYYK